MQDRLTEIEIKVAHIEQSLNELSDVLYRQQELITRLEQMCEHLQQRIQASGEGIESTNPTDDKPPHY